MVTHDRYFLDSVTNRIIELDKGKIYSYQEQIFRIFGNVRQKEKRVTKPANVNARVFLRKEIEWWQRGARARSTSRKLIFKDMKI